MIDITNYLASVLLLKALSEEKTAYEKSTTKSIYLNLISNAVKRLRDESPLSKTLSPKNPKAMSHEAILGGSKAATTSFTINRWGKPLPLPKTFSGIWLNRFFRIALKKTTSDCCVCVHVCVSACLCLCVCVCTRSYTYISHCAIVIYIHISFIILDLYSYYYYIVVMLSRCFPC